MRKLDDVGVHPYHEEQAGDGSCIIVCAASEFIPILEAGHTDCATHGEILASSIMHWKIQFILCNE